MDCNICSVALRVRPRVLAFLHTIKKSFVQALDKAVAEATDLRKSEHAEFKTLMSDDTNAKEVLLWAKNRLNKFYNPKM